MDFDDPGNNDFLVVRQLTVAGADGQTIRPDLGLYVNGLPLAFGWVKQTGGMRKTRFRGLLKVSWQLLMTAAAFNLWRLPKLNAVQSTLPVRLARLDNRLLTRSGSSFAASQTCGLMAINQTGHVEKVTILAGRFVKETG